MEDFNSCKNNCSIVDIKMIGGTMSWCNGHDGQNRKWAKLDRTLVNVQLLTIFQLATIEYLMWKTYDHRSMLIWFTNSTNRYGPQPFRYRNMWSSNIFYFMKWMWNRLSHGLSLLKLVGKLKNSKIALKKWNTQIFCRVDQNIRDLET